MLWYLGRVADMTEESWGCWVELSCASLLYIELLHCDKLY